MKKSIELEIELLANKLANQYKAVKALESKIEKYSRELENLQTGVNSTCNSLYLLGYREPRKDGKTETPEEAANKEKYNAALWVTKKQVLKETLDRQNPYIWEEIKDLLPDFMQ